MRTLLVLLMFGIGVASVQAQTPCDTNSDFKGGKEPGVLALLEELRGTVAMSGHNVCSGALVTFTGRSNSAPALVLSAAHCSDRGKAQIPMKNGSLAVLDDGEVLYHLE